MAEITATSTLDSNPGAARHNRGPSWPTSIFDHLLVAADGRKVGEVDNAVLCSLLAPLNIPGFDFRNGRQSNLELFAAAYQKIADADGRNGVLKWLQGIAP